MKFFHPILILTTAYLISGLEKIDNKCGLDRRNFKMALKNGPAEVFFLTGNNGTCIAGVKDELPFEDAKGSCEKLFSGGKMMSYENYGELRSKIIGTDFKYSMATSFMMKGNDCWYVTNNEGDLMNYACKTTTVQYNYMCQYPMQYNCAFQNEYIEMVAQSVTKVIMNRTVFSYANEIGTEKQCQPITKETLQCSLVVGEATDWTSCSESCTEPTKPPPTQTMKQQMNTGCFNLTKSADITYLHSLRSCNGHVLCPPASTDKPSFTDKPLPTDKDAVQPDSSMLPIIFGSLGGFLFVVLVAIVFVCCYRWRRKRDNLPTSGDGSSQRRSRRPSLNDGHSTSRRSPSKKRRSRSSTPSTGQKSDVVSRRESANRGGGRPSPSTGQKSEVLSRHESPIRGRKGDAATSRRKSPIGGRKGDAAIKKESPRRKGDTANAHGSVATIDEPTTSGWQNVGPNELIQDYQFSPGTFKAKRLLSVPAIVGSSVQKMAKSKYHTI